jgi:antitoxin MazE
MKARVQKWGNSLAVRLPQAFAKEAGIEESSAVDISVEEGRIVMAAVSPPAYSLEQLVSGITPENLHAEISTGGPVGNEAW